MFYIPQHKHRVFFSSYFVPLNKCLSNPITTQTRGLYVPILGLFYAVVILLSQFPNLGLVKERFTPSVICSNILCRKVACEAWAHPFFIGIIGGLGLSIPLALLVALFSLIYRWIQKIANNPLL